jgi:hypothetical protein
MNLGNRSLRLVLFAVAVGALGFGAYVAKSGVAQKAEAQRTAALARDRARDTGQALVYAQQRDKWVSSATQLVSDSKQSGIAPEQWVERKVNYRGVSAARVEADRLVRDTAVAQGRLFVTENFEISVLGGGEGLFDTPSAEDRGLVLTLAGSYYAWDLARTPMVPAPTLQVVQNAATASVAIVGNAAPGNASSGSLKK